MGGPCFDFESDVFGPDVSFSVAAKKPFPELYKRVKRFVRDLAFEARCPSEGSRAIAPRNGLGLRVDLPLQPSVLALLFHFRLHRASFCMRVVCAR